MSGSAASRCACLVSDGWCLEAWIHDSRERGDDAGGGGAEIGELGVTTAEADALRAAVRAGYVTTLVTTAALAQELI